MAKIIAKAPMRVDFTGGTIDIAPLYLWHYPALTINAAITLYATATITESDVYTITSRDQNITASWKTLDEVNWSEYPMLELVCRIVKSFDPKPLTIEINSEAPAGSGLGGSSALAVAVVAAMAKYAGKELNQQQILNYALSIETQVIKVPAGSQDHSAAVYGGLRSYAADLFGVIQSEMLSSAGFRGNLAESMLLVYTGKPHFSGTNNWELFKKHVDGDKHVVDFFEEIKRNSEAMKAAIAIEDITNVGKVLTQDWQLRKATIPAMSTPAIDALVEQTMGAGALGARVCGSGGGGCCLILADPSKHDAIKKIVTDLEMQILPVGIEESGVTCVA